MHISWPNEVGTSGSGTIDKANASNWTCTTNPVSWGTSGSGTSSERGTCRAGPHVSSCHNAHPVAKSHEPDEPKDYERSAFETNELWNAVAEVRWSSLSGIPSDTIWKSCATWKCWDSKVMGVLVTKDKGPPIACRLFRTLSLGSGTFSTGLSGDQLVPDPQILSFVRQINY